MLKFRSLAPIAFCLFATPLFAGDLADAIGGGTFAKGGVCEGDQEEVLRLINGEVLRSEAHFSCEIFDLETSAFESGTGMARALCNLGDVDERVIDDFLFVRRSDDEIEITSRNESMMSGNEDFSFGITGTYTRC